MNYSIGVRALCEFTAKGGDLDLRFTPAPTSLQGIVGHQVVAARRGVDYQTEVKLVGLHKCLTIRGRADGYDAARHRLEEIKTYRGELAAMPPNHRTLHWAQAKIYGWLLCNSQALQSIEIALIYFNVDNQRETALAETFMADELQQFFDVHCERFLQWAAREVAHRRERNTSLATLRFPHTDFRCGQRELAEAVYKAASTGRCLMAQAPTGIGKTVGTLFPLLKAMPTQSLDKIFYLAAKTPGRKLALDALALLIPANSALRIVELIARDKACEYLDKACHGESCPLAQGFYDRLPAARNQAAAVAILDRKTLREIALTHRICPYYLAQEMTRWSDVVVGDYNYFFDSSALLYGLTLDNDWRTAVLVDEAHNLIDRGRAMYSAELRLDAVRELKKRVPPTLKKMLNRVERLWRELQDRQVENYRASNDLPRSLLVALQLFVSSASDYFVENPTLVDASLQAFFFEAVHFGRIAEMFGEHSLFDVTKQRRQQRLSSIICIRNLVPASFLAPRFALTQSTVLFSATLQPQQFYRDLLGLPNDTAWIDVESPFSAAQLSIVFADHISTRYAQRSASLPPITQLISEQFEKKPGNYLAFFSSFEYLERAVAVFRERCPHIPHWVQSRQMDEAARAEFLGRFEANGLGIGFAVLGGAFGEGIDLPGNRLIGAFIATLGLPQVNPVNEMFKVQLEKRFGAGYDYTYLYPGLQKVIQAAGRVIRTVDDTGHLFLIDDRFSDRAVRALLPRWWLAA